MSHGSHRLVFMNQTGYGQKEVIVRGKPATEASIVIVVLWGILFLSMLAVACTGYVRPQLGLALRLNDRAQRIAVAKAGVQQTMWNMAHTATGAFLTLNACWTQNGGCFSNLLPVGKGVCAILAPPDAMASETNPVYGLVDEERKLNINTASNTMLERLVALVGGITSQQAAEVACAIVDWRDADGESMALGTENSYYATLHPSYACKNKPFESMDELLLVKGVSQVLFQKIASRLTVYGRGTLNINTAEACMLQCAGASEESIASIVAFRRGKDGLVETADDGVFSNKAQIVSLLSTDQMLSSADRAGLARILDVRSDCFGGRCVARLNGKQPETVVDFVFGLDGKIRYWREH